MSGARSDGSKPKKLVNRNVVVALGMICIVLVIVCLVEAFVYYTPIMSDNEKISSLNSQIVSLNDSLNDQILEQNQTISSLDAQLAALQEQAASIHIFGQESSLNFFENKRTVSVEAAAPTIIAGSGDVNASSGYVVNWVSSNNNSTYITVVVYVNATSYYSQTINVGSEGIAIFPIPVAVFFEVEVGVSSGSATVTWSALYVH